MMNQVKNVKKGKSDIAIQLIAFATDRLMSWWPATIP
jgi:hypothetical protein